MTVVILLRQLFDLSVRHNRDSTLFLDCEGNVLCDGSGGGNDVPVRCREHATHGGVIGYLLEREDLRVDLGTLLRQRGHLLCESRLGLQRL